MLKIIFILFLTATLTFCQPSAGNLDPDNLFGDLGGILGLDGSGSGENPDKDLIGKACRFPLQCGLFLDCINGKCAETSGGGDEDLLGKACGSVLDCGIGFLYCIKGKCAYKEAGVDCVAEGQPWTGGQSCCPPLANPHEKGMPCKFLDTSRCRDDRTCEIRLGNKYKCCIGSDGDGGCCTK